MNPNNPTTPTRPSTKPRRPLARFTSISNDTATVVRTLDIDDATGKLAFTPTVATVPTPKPLQRLTITIDSEEIMRRIDEATDPAIISQLTQLTTVSEMEAEIERDQQRLQSSR